VFFGGPETLNCQKIASLGDGQYVPILTIGPLSPSGFQYLCKDSNIPYSQEALTLVEKQTGLWPTRIFKEAGPLQQGELYGSSTDLKEFVVLVQKLSHAGSVRLSEVEEYATLDEISFTEPLPDIAHAAVRLGLLLDDGEQRYRLPIGFAKLLDSGGIRHD
jgi:hypothetical protein